MVEGLAQFQRRWGAIPNAVRTAVQAAMEKSADEIVAAANGEKPLPEIDVAWTWGKPPDGALEIASAESPGQSLRISIYATAMIESGSFPAIARWFEFGTAPRYTKAGKYTGRITARPYFYPVWRSYRRRVRSRLTRAMNKAIKSL